MVWKKQGLCLICRTFSAIVTSYCMAVTQLLIGDCLQDTSQHTAGKGAWRKKEGGTEG